MYTIEPSGETAGDEVDMLEPVVNSQRFLPVTTSTAYSFLSFEPTYRIEPYTAGLLSTAPPVFNFHFKAPEAESQSRRRKSRPSRRILRCHCQIMRARKPQRRLCRISKAEWPLPSWHRPHK